MEDKAAHESTNAGMNLRLLFREESKQAFSGSKCRSSIAAGPRSLISTITDGTDQRETASFSFENMAANLAPTIDSLKVSKEGKCRLEIKRALLYCICRKWSGLGGSCRQAAANWNRLPQRYFLYTWQNSFGMGSCAVDVWLNKPRILCPTIVTSSETHVDMLRPDATPLKSPVLILNNQKTNASSLSMY